MLYEPGPIELIRDDQIPRPRGIEHHFESLVSVPIAGVHERDVIVGLRRADLVAVTAADVDGDFARTVIPAADELGAQLGTMHPLDPAAILEAALAGVREADGYAGDLPPEGATSDRLSFDGEDRSGRRSQTFAWTLRAPVGSEPTRDQHDVAAAAT
jgi:hypothetical protein